jgi:hypothetical protein
VGGVRAGYGLGMRAVLGGVIIALGLVPMLLWLIARFNYRNGVYAWRTGRPVTQAEARELDARSGELNQRLEKSMRRLAPWGIVLVIAGIVLASI